MIALNQFSIKTIKKSDSEAEFQVSPLPKGYGYTVGNIFRRILLSSIPGSAISAVKIDGITHEYTSLEGMKDDALTVLLSMKNVVVKSNTEENVELEIDVTCGSDTKDVTAGDIKKNSAVEIINPDYVITTLTKKGARFKASIIVSKGVGYAMPENDVRQELGMIPIDPTFTPVSLVTYEVVQTRVGQQTDLDQLNLTIKTNSSLTPEETFHTASNILSNTTKHLFDQAEKVINGQVAPELLSTQMIDQQEDEWNAQKPPQGISNKASLPIVDLNLSTRLTNALLRSGYDDLTMLEGMTREDLANIRGMGAKSLDELVDILEKNDITVI